ncbi:unnamed protein product, partial [Brenthis ino]
MESGAVGLVLRLSRVMGIAPYPRGSRLRVSKALVVYGFVLVTFIRMNTMNRYRKMPKVAWEMAKNEDTALDVNSAVNMNNINKNNYIFTYIDVLGANETERTEYMIRQLAVYYRHICVIIRTWTSSDGLLMALILINRMFHLVQLLLSLIMGLTQNSDLFLNVLLYSSMNIINHVMALVLFVEPFQRTHFQMERTSIIVQTLKCNCGEYRPLRNELDLFLRMLKLQKTSYSPLNMCTLGRPLVLKIFGGLFTYLMVILTYGPEAQTPSLVFTNYF